MNYSSVETVNKLAQYMRDNGLNQVNMACQLGTATSQLNRWLRTGRMSRLWVEKLKGLGIIQ